MTEKQARSFWDKVTFRSDGCWEWTAAVLKGQGYGQVFFSGRNHRAHGLTWQAFRGEQPQGSHLHHTCGNRRCVNPHHLELVTPKEHSHIHHRAENPRFDTHCSRGHERDGNTYVRANGHTICRPCQNLLKKQKRSSARASTIYV